MANQKAFHAHSFHANPHEDSLQRTQFAKLHENPHHEKSILGAFRTFTDHCVNKFRDGFVNTSQQKPMNDTSMSSDTNGLLCVDGTGQRSSMILEDLPFYCKLVILAQLDTIDICNLSMTNRHWSNVCSDQLLWRELAHRDIIKWSSIGHKSNPLLPLNKVSEQARKRVNYDEKYMEVSLDFHERLCVRGNLNFKALYFHCAYQKQQIKQVVGCVTQSPISSPHEPKASVSPQTNSAASQSFPKFLRSWWMRFTKGNGKVIMLGPGMESANTGKIFDQLLWKRPDILTIVRLLPGSQDGLGSGVELDFKGEKRFSLIALYSGNNRERSLRVGLERLQQSNIIEEIDDTSSSSHTPALLPSKDLSMQNFHFKLREAVSNFLSQNEIDCYLIYVVDATGTQPLEQLWCNRLEIDAVLDGMQGYELSSMEGENTSNEEGMARDDASFTFGNFLGKATRQHCASDTPLLVLCCTANATTPRIPCIEVVSLLDLASLQDRPWLAQDVTVDNLNGLEDGFMWLFNQL